MLVTHDQMASLPIYGLFLWNQWTDFHERLCVARGHIPLFGERTGLVVRALDSGWGDPGSILGRVGVLFP